MDKLIGIIIVLATVLSAPAESQSKNLREVCRIDVSLRLMNQHNDFLVFSSQSQLWKNKLDKSQQALAATRKTLAGHRQRSLKQPFDKVLEDQIIGSENRLGIFAGQLDLGKQQLRLINQKQLKLQKDIKGFKQAIAPVFATIKKKVQNSQAFTYSVNYRHRCSQFQLLCPLPEKQRKALAKIADWLDDPISCQRYSQMLVAGESVSKTN